MATVALNRPRATTSRLAAHLRDPMQRSGYALISGSVVTSVLGMVFWIVAARLFPPADLGRASATIAAMTFVANAATLGLRNGFVRFLPTAGRDAGRFIARSYALCVAVAVGGAVLFLVGQPWWADGLGYLRADGFSAAFFVLATAGWVVFVLQDSVLTGLRLATWVPVENAVFAVAKIVLLFAFVAIPAWGIFAAWSIPSMVLAVPLNLLIFRHLRRRRAGTHGGSVTVPEVIRFAAGDHLAAFLWLGTTELLGLVVLAQIGAAASAVYFLSFSVAYTLYLVTSNVSSAFVVESTLHPGRRDDLLGQAFVQTTRIVVPAALLGIVAAPYLLRLFGPVYERQGTPLLRLLLASAIPQILVGLAVGFSRARRRVGVVVAIYATTALCLFTGAYVGLESVGLVAVGWTWLVTQCVLAVVVLLTVLQALWLRHLGGPVLRMGAAARRTWRQTRRGREARQAVPRALIRAGWALPDDVEVLRSLNDVVVAKVWTGGTEVVVKVAQSRSGRDGLRRNADNLRRLARIEGLDELSSRLPRVLESRRIDDEWLVVESVVPGRSLEGQPVDVRKEACAEVIVTVGELHRETGTPTTFDADMDRCWIEEPIETLRSVPRLARFDEELDSLAAWLRVGLADRSVTRCWIVGDLCAGNLHVDPASPSHLTGIIDWENARPDGFAELDLAHLWLTEQPGEVGGELLAHLDRPPDIYGESSLPARAVLVLAWLSHIAAGIDRADANPHSPVWLARNVEPVLAAAPTFPAPDQTPQPVPTPVAVESLSPDPVGPIAVPPGSASRADVGAVATIVGAVALWIAGGWNLDPRAMSEYGLLSLLTPAMLVGLGILTVGFAFALRRPARNGILGAYVSVLILMLHGTPPAIYETLRYSWSWKHVGVVDYILRNGAVDTTIDTTPIYHSWPGFFGAGALLTELVGAPDALRIAMWAPVAFNVMNLLVLRFLLRSLTDDRRAVWLALWLFFTTNWVGQDYFSPQAMSYVLYLALVAVLIRSYWRSSTGLRVLAPQLPERGALAAAVVLMSALAVSHQITPMMAVIALTALFATRRIHGWYLPALAGGAVVAWALTVGRGIVSDDATSLWEAVGRPFANVEGTLEKTRTIADSQLVISQAGRLVVAAIGMLAVVGGVRLLRRRRLSPTLVVLTLCPAALPLLTEFGGEIVFRMFIFAAPGLVLLAASAIHPDNDPVRGGSTPRLVATVIVTLGFSFAFLIPYYGKDSTYYFTPEEVAASEWVAENAPPGSLLVEGSRNYPGQFRNYENFLYVPIDREDTDVWQRILDDPETELQRWLDNPDHPAAYVLLTRGQRMSSDLQGPMPRGALDEIEAALRGSPFFDVAFDSGDGVVFVLHAESGDAP